MPAPMRLQVLTCLVLYTSCVQAIMVKFGTKGGPIEPPVPESTLPPPLPYRAPAPVWDFEARTGDAPDPNAQWRPQLFKPQPRFTEVAFNLQPLNNAQRFVNAYKTAPQPIPAQPMKNYFTPAQILSSQSLPGFGIRYFVPAYLNELQSRKALFRQEDARHNQIETNEVDGNSRDAASDAQWKYEKDQSRRALRHAQVASPLPYQWPVYVPHQ